MKVESWRMEIALALNRHRVLDRARMFRLFRKELREIVTKMLAAVYLIAQLWWRKGPDIRDKNRSPDFSWS